MPKIEIDIPNEWPCDQCGQPFALEENTCPSCEAPALRLHYTNFLSQVEQGFIMDARFGGLVIGDPGPEDYIPMYANIGQGIFSIVGFMHGWEYITSLATTVKHSKLLERINSDTGPTPRSFLLPDKPVTTINTNIMPRGCGIWITRGQFVINSFATSRNLELLESMNELSTRNAIFVEWEQLQRSE